MRQGFGHRQPAALRLRRRGEGWRTNVRERESER
uniref:Uncharacterized protein n=1 Tax=Arundo donax TaxID=35708 RepID=A0A0A8ZSZ4_ARUDO